MHNGPASIVASQIALEINNNTLMAMILKVFGKTDF